MIFTAFYTPGRYEDEVARLRRSLDRLGLPHDIRQRLDLGNWMANTQQTAAHIAEVMADHPDEAVVQLDADAVVWRDPSILREMDPSKYDIAVHYRGRRPGNRGELLNGTVWLAPTDGGRAVAERYLSLIRSDPGCTNEQTKLDMAIEQTSPRLFHLPAEYCWIHDLMAADIGDSDPVIEHLQASREVNLSHMTESRHRRLREIEGLL